MGMDANGLRNRFGAFGTNWIHAAHGAQRRCKLYGQLDAADLEKSAARIDGEKGRREAEQEERVATSGELTSDPGVLPYAIFFHSRRRFRVQSCG